MMHSATAQKKYQEVAQLTVSKAKTAFPGLPVREVKFVQVVTPQGVEPRQKIELTGAIQGENITITLPEGAEPGIQFEVPYVVFNLEAGHYVVGDPFIVDWEKKSQAADAAPRAPQAQAPNPNPQGVPMPDPMTKYPSEWRELGNNAFKEGKYDEAGALYTAGLERERRYQVEQEKLKGIEDDDVEDVEASFFGKIHLLFNNRAMVLVKLGRLKDALADVDRALSCEPEFVKAHYQRGMIFQKSGGLQNLRLAVQAFEKADEIDSKNFGAGASDGGKEETAASKALRKVQARIRQFLEREQAKLEAKQQAAAKRKEQVAAAATQATGAGAGAGVEAVGSVSTEGSSHLAADSPVVPTPVMQQQQQGGPVLVPLNGAAMNAPVVKWHELYECGIAQRYTAQ